MSFQSALVDRGRKIETRIGHRDPALGESETLVQPGQWYKIRLNPPDSAEDRSGNEATKHQLRAEILVPKDFDLALSDRLEIESKELGRAIWIVDGDPKILRRKRTAIGKSATVIRVSNI
jgi:hypothetical protein